MPIYFDLEVTLVLPRRVWRRFLLAKSATFWDLHLAIQDAFGWQNCHLFEFRHPGALRTAIAGLPDPEGWDDRPVPHARHVRLRDAFWVGATSAPGWLEYEYDFGDGWVHEVKLRGEVKDAATFKRRLLDGERAAPPEDCGGEGGYLRYTSIVERGVDPDGESVEEGLAWLRGWQPERFDRDAAARAFERAPARAGKRRVEEAEVPSNVIAFPSGKGTRH